MNKNTDKRVDAYIDKSDDFAKPILTHLRALIHSACPQVVETIKWGMPYFEYKGTLCGMASFKKHCAFVFWKESLMKGMKELGKEKTAMGSLGRIESLSDLPKDNVLITLIKEAVRLNEEGIKTPPRVKHTDKELSIPSYFMKAIRAHKKALETFEKFSFSNKRDYVEWITQIKNNETRKQRMVQAVEWMSQGKVRFWKYTKN